VAGYKGAAGDTGDFEAVLGYADDAFTS